MAVHAFNPTQEDLRSSPALPTGMVPHTYNHSTQEVWKDQTLRAILSHSEFKASLGHVRLDIKHDHNSTQWSPQTMLPESAGVP